MNVIFRIIRKVVILLEIPASVIFFTTMCMQIQSLITVTNGIGPYQASKGGGVGYSFNAEDVHRIFAARISRYAEELQVTLQVFNHDFISLFIVLFV